LLAPVAVVAVGSLTLSACGSNAQPAATAAVPMTPMTPTAPAAGPLAVTIRDFMFSPATLTVTAGSTVTWTNQDEEPHTVMGDGLKSPVLGNAGSSFKHTFATPGTYTYVCSIHPFMHGTVTVTS
jgi:plastocyanin